MNGLIVLYIVVMVLNVPWSWFWQGWTPDHGFWFEYMCNAVITTVIFGVLLMIYIARNGG